MEKTPGIRYHSRISYSDIAKLLPTAGIWIYPTGFYEISCMAAMEAQIAGCFPVCSPVGALPETVITTSGAFCDSPDSFVTQTSRILARGQDLTCRKQMAALARAEFDIIPLARSWLQHFDE
jgi:glycosyltransferase involved in cell wall biosynthesis